VSLSCAEATSGGGKNQADGFEGLTKDLTNVQFPILKSDPRNSNPRGTSGFFGWEFRIGELSIGQIFTDDGD
jgi:hypothetical protein